MKYPIVKIKTFDNLSLFGLYTEFDSDTILINIHGTASAFYIEEFEEYYFNKQQDLKIALLFTNNRGNQVMESWQKTGAAYENFEDCIEDINKWIEYVLSKGYQKIILQGHSLGSEKVVYYMNKGKYKETVVTVILLGFSDSFGTHYKDMKGKTDKLMNEAQKLVKRGKGYQFLTSEWLSHAGVLPMSAESYLNFFTPNSELSKALPLRNGNNLKMFSKIDVPILGVIGDQKEWTVIPVKQAIKLMEKENKNFEVDVIKGANHSFEGYQEELVDVVQSFLESSG